MSALPDSVDATEALLAAARELRAELSRTGGTVYYPRTEFCTDNGAMIAFTGCRRLELEPAAYSSVRVEARPRWPLEELTGS